VAIVQVGSQEATLITKFSFVEACILLGKIDEGLHSKVRQIKNVIGKAIIRASQLKYEKKNQLCILLKVSN
jgi:hypothetical protein